jgi:hypothetical protein
MQQKGDTHDRTALGRMSHLRFPRLRRNHGWPQAPRQGGGNLAPLGLLAGFLRKPGPVGPGYRISPPSGLFGTLARIHESRRGPKAAGASHHSGERRGARGAGLFFARAALRLSSSTQNLIRQFTKNGPVPSSTFDVPRATIITRSVSEGVNRRLPRSVPRYLADASDYDVRAALWAGPWREPEWCG